MTEDELEDLLNRHPVIYHMAEGGSWPLIRKYGLLCTGELLDLCGVTGAQRFEFESQRRHETREIAHQEGSIYLRDNLPIDDKSLQKCLQDGLTVRNWYEILNSRVFFWLTKERLLRLLCARAYAAKAHDVLEVDARRLVNVYREQISLSPINSGCTKPVAQPRGKTTFLPISEYPYRSWKKRRRKDAVVELAVTRGVPNIEHFVRRVVRMQGEDELNVMYSA